MESSWNDIESKTEEGNGADILGFASCSRYLGPCMKIHNCYLSQHFPIPSDISVLTVHGTIAYLILFKIMLKSFAAFRNIVGLQP